VNILGPHFGWNKAKQFMSGQEEDIAKDSNIRHCVELLAFQTFKLIVKTTVALWLVHCAEELRNTQK